MKGFMMAKRKSIHYVNNADFSQAVVDYVSVINSARKKKQQIPKCSDLMKCNNC